MTHTEALERAKRGRAAFSMAGAIRTVRMRRSKAGNPFAWVEVSDATGEFEVTVFSETLNSARDLMEPGNLVLMTVGAEEWEGDIRFTCEGMRALDRAAASAASQLRVTVNAPSALESVKSRLAGVKPATRQEGGQVVIQMRLAETGHDVEITLPELAACTPAMRGALKAVDGVGDVELI